MILIYILMEAIEPRFDPVGRTATSCSRLWLKTSTQACFFNASPLPPLPREKTALLIHFENKFQNFICCLFFLFSHQTKSHFVPKGIQKCEHIFGKRRKQWNGKTFVMQKLKWKEVFDAVATLLRRKSLFILNCAFNSF